MRKKLIAALGVLSALLAFSALLLLFRQQPLASAEERMQVYIALALEGILVLALSILSWLRLRDESRQRQAVDNELANAKEQALQASRMKSQFLANISHEIRTPMHGIMGMTEMALETDLTDQQRQYLTTALASGRALQVIIDDIFEYSLNDARTEKGSIILEHQPFQLRKLLNELISDFELQAKNKGLKLSLTIQPAIPDAFMGDMLRLRKILTNLVANAIKFTPAGEIKLDVALDSESGNKARLHFSVSDTGIGLSREKQRLIFEPFTQADNTMTRQYEGTGLGLSICAKLAEQMDGQLWVESQKGKGSTFHFSIQLEVQSETTTINTVQGSASPMKILLAEDNKVNQEVAVHILQREGHGVTIAENGADALKLLSREPFDLILMDLHMPVMDGYMATLAIRELERGSGKRIPIVALTADILKDDIRRCIDVGMDAHLGKPFDRRKLLEVIHNVTSGNQESLLADPPSREQKVQSVENKDDVLDPEYVLDRVNGNFQYLQRLLELFRKTSEEQLARINDAISRQDATLLREAAHSLKGGIAVFTSGPAYHVAGELEMRAMANDLAAAPDLTQALHEEMNRLDQALDRLCAMATPA